MPPRWAQFGHNQRGSSSLPIAEKANDGLVGHQMRIGIVRAIAIHGLSRLSADEDATLDLDPFLTSFSELLPSRRGPRPVQQLIVGNHLLQAVITKHETPGYSRPRAPRLRL